jgi:hypothetical protein
MSQVSIPEQHVRETIDRLLTQAGWDVDCLEAEFREGR